MGYKSFQEDCNAKEMQKIVHLEISFSPKKKKKTEKMLKILQVLLYKAYKLMW